MFRFLALFSAMMLAIAPAQAAVIFSSDNGWYDRAGFHDPDNSNTVTQREKFVSFYTFDLTGAEKAGSLSVTFIGGNGDFVNTGGPRLNLIYIADYYGDVDALVDGTAGAEAISDLVSNGVSRVLTFPTASGLMPELTFELSPEVVNHFNSDRGSGKFALRAFYSGNGALWSGSGIVPAAFLTTTPAVPEPATWALMIAGFGVVGLSMRRRRARSHTSGAEGSDGLQTAAGFPAANPCPH